jgi:hypothetical protein
VNRPRPGSAPPAIYVPSLVPLGELAFTAPDWVWDPPLEHADDALFQAAYLGFLDQMLATAPPEVTVTILTHELALARAHSWVNARRQAGTRLVPIDNTCRFTVWARDLFLVRLGAGGPTAFAPCAFPRAQDEEFAPMAAAALGLPFERSDVFFQGGNVIADERAILIGADDHAITLSGRPERAPRMSAAHFARRLAASHHALVLSARGFSRTQNYLPLDGREGWLERHHAGSPPDSRQPVYHLDMSLAPLGDGRIAVGDIRLARDILAVGTTDIALDLALDDIAQQLVRAGYVVTRAPLPLLSYDDIESKVRTWYFASPLNVISDPIRRRVWVPVLANGADANGLAAINQFHTKLWRAAGFDVIPLNGLDPILRRLGGPRCLAQAVPRHYQ